MFLFVILSKLDIFLCFWDEKGLNRLFQELSFSKNLIEQPRIKRLKNIDLLHELPLYNDLNIEKISKVLIGYARSYTEITDLKDPLIQLEATKSSIKYLFEDLLHEIKGFKCQITVKMLLTKHKEMEIQNLLLFILILLLKWRNNEGSDYVIELTEADYVNISVFSPLSGSTYIKLPNKLRNPMKGLINIKNNDTKCFLSYHIRHLHALKIHPERITKVYENMVNNLDYKGIKFAVSKKNYCKIERKNNICINAFCYENDWVYPVHVSDHLKAYWLWIYSWWQTEIVTLCPYQRFQQIYAQYDKQ